MKSAEAEQAVQTVKCLLEDQTLTLRYYRPTTLANGFSMELLFETELPQNN